MKEKNAGTMLAWEYLLKLFIIQVELPFPLIFAMLSTPCLIRDHAYIMSSRYGGREGIGKSMKVN